MTKYDLAAAAQRYAEALVAYYAATEQFKRTNSAEDSDAVRVATAAMYNRHQDLDFITRELAMID